MHAGLQKWTLETILREWHTKSVLPTPLTCARRRFSG